MSNHNKLVFIQTGETEKFEKFHIVCSMCVVNEETFKNLVVLENLRFANLEKIKNTYIDEEETLAKGISSCIAPAFKISGNEYFVHDSLREIVDKLIKQIKGEN